MIVEHRELIIFLSGMLLGYLMRNKRAKGYFANNFYSFKKGHHSILE